MKCINRSLLTVNQVFITVLMFITILTGCAPIGLLSENQSYSGKEVVPLPNPRTDILDVISATGKYIGFGNVTIRDKNGTRGSGLSGGSPSLFDMPMPSGVLGIITLVDTPGIVGSTLVGRNASRHLTISVRDPATSIDIDYSVGGNFGNGTKETADKLLADFKTELFNRIKQ